MPPDDGEVHFESQGEEFGSPPERAGGLDFTRVLVKWGLVSSRQEAQYVLIVIVVLVIVIAGFIFFHSGSGTPPPPAVTQ